MGFHKFCIALTNASSLSVQRSYLYSYGFFNQMFHLGGSVTLSGFKPLISQFQVNYITHLKTKTEVRVCAAFSRRWVKIDLFKYYFQCFVIEMLTFEDRGILLSIYLYLGCLH